MSGERTRRQRAGAPAAREKPLLAEAKLAAPRQQPDIIDRPHLFETLDSGDGSELTLVAAPAGFGKTTAVRAWCASRARPFAWITLDAGDNDPVRLWTYVATAVDRVREGLGRGALERLHLAGGAVEAAIDELTNGLSALTQDLVIVVDDLQTVTDKDCLASIDYALENLPPAARVIAISRADPALRLAKRRADRGLVELRAGDLAFTKDEARRLVIDNGGVDVEPDEIQTLHERTEGWPAALMLASIWLRTVEDLPRAVREFGGGHRFVADYLSEEVLSALDDDMQTFLLSASVLGRFTPELCDSVLARSNSASLLAELERTNLLVSRLEHGGWYRVHSLLAQFATAQLAAMDPTAAKEINRRAGVWLMEQGFQVEAAQHAAAAGDHELVARLMVEHHLTLIRNGGARTLLLWVRSLPDATIVRHPELAVGGAAAAAMVGQSTLEQRRLLRLAERARAQHADRFSPYAAAAGAMVRAAIVDGHVGQSVDQGRQAVELATAAADSVLVAAHAGHARALYFAGDLDAAWAAGMLAIEHPEAERRPPGHALARSTLALVAVEKGHLRSARTHAEKAKAIVGRLGVSRSWIGANAAAALGAVQLAEGQLAEAEREFASAERFFRDEVATVHHAWLLVMLARVRCGRGRLDEARATLRSARDELDDLADGGRVPSLAAEVAAQLDRSTSRAVSREPVEAPSEAELAVLRLLASDLTTREIGAELFLSANTIRTHTRAIYRKLRVSSRVEAVARAGELGLMSDTNHLGDRRAARPR